MIQPCRDLPALIQNMQPVLSPSLFVFVTLKNSLLLESVSPQCLFKETEGLSAILERSDAESLGLTNLPSFRMITLSVNSDLQAVGFLALVTNALAKEGIPCNAVSAFHHDYLFVPENSATDSMRILADLSALALKKSDLLPLFWAHKGL